MSRPEIVHLLLLAAVALIVVEGLVMWWKAWHR